MKILILNWRDFQNPKSGGAEVLTYEIAKRWVKQGHSVIWFASTFKNCKQSEEISGIKIVRAGKPDIRHLHNSVYFKAFIFYRKIRKAGLDLVVDEIHGIPFFTNVYVREKKIAFICEVAKDIWDRMYPFPWNIIGKIVERLSLLSYRGIKFITISDSTKKDLITYGIPIKNITILPMGISRYKVDKNNKEHHPTAIFVARLNKMKGVEDAILSWKHVVAKSKNAKLWIVGKGDDQYVSFLKSLVERSSLNNNIVFWGYISEKKKFELMSRSHVIISPSIREGFGLTIPEAGSVGTPAVVYNSPGLRDIVDNTNGIVVKKNTPLHLANAVIKIFSDVKLRENLSRQAYKKSLQYDWNETAKKFTQVMKLS